MNKQASRPLEGIRIIEVGQLLAGPFAGTLLSYFGAEVIKVVPPQDGDPIPTHNIAVDTTTLLMRTSMLSTDSL